LKRLLLLYLSVTGLCMAQLTNSTLSLREAIELALTQSTPADADAAVAKARLAWLEAASHRRTEIRPQAAIWTLVNPVALATTVGAGLLANGKTATPLNVLDARIDSAAAAVEVQRHRFHREVEVTEKYMALALQQQAANQTCLMVSDALQQRSDSQQELRVARATRLDVLWQEQAVLEHKSACRRSDQAVAIAALALSSLVQRSVEDVRATEIRVENPSELPLESAEALYELARVYRQDLAAGQTAKQRILELWDELEATHDRRVRVVLKDNGSFEAEKRLMAEKIRRLESQTNDLERQIQARIAEVRIRIESLQDQIELAEQRVALAVEQSEVTEVRLQAGLTDRLELARAKEAEQQASFEVARLRSEDTANVAALVAVVGLGDETQSRQALVYDATVVSARLR
jgi:hypothetical protein